MSATQIFQKIGPVHYPLSGPYQSKQALIKHDSYIPKAGSDEYEMADAIMQYLFDRGIARIYANAAAIAEIVKDLGDRIHQDFCQEWATQPSSRLGEIIMVGVLKGATNFHTELTKKLTPLTSSVEYVKISSYTPEGGRRRLKWEIPPAREDYRNCTVIIVEDLIDTGVSAESLSKEYADRGARVLFVAAFNKAGARPESESHLEHASYVGPDITGKAWGIGYGMDADEFCRGLPYLTIVPEDRKQDYIEALRHKEGIITAHREKQATLFRNAPLHHDACSTMTTNADPLS